MRVYVLAGEGWQSLGTLPGIMFFFSLILVLITYYNSISSSPYGSDSQLHEIQKQKHQAEGNTDLPQTQPGEHVSMLLDSRERTEGGPSNGHVFI